MKWAYGFSGFVVFFFQAEDGIRDAQESRGLGDVYKRQTGHFPHLEEPRRFAGLLVDFVEQTEDRLVQTAVPPATGRRVPCLLYTSDAADEEDSVDLGG